MSANVALSETFDQWRVKTNELMIMTQTGGSSNFVKLTNTNDSTSNTTGSIITAGGAGFAKSMVVGENINVHGNLHANGNVVVVSDSGYTLTTSEILWDNRYRMIIVEDSVMFTTSDGDTLYGVGFESDMDLERWKISRPFGIARDGI